MAAIKKWVLGKSIGPLLNLRLYLASNNMKQMVNTCEMHCLALHIFARKFATRCGVIFLQKLVGDDVTLC